MVYGVWYSIQKWALEENSLTKKVLSIYRPSHRSTLILLLYWHDDAWVFIDRGTFRVEGSLCRLYVDIRRKNSAFALYYLLWIHTDSSFRPTLVMSDSEILDSGEEVWCGSGRPVIASYKPLPPSCTPQFLYHDYRIEVGGIGFLG